MKKKILTSTIIVIVFSLVIMTSFYIVISNYKYIDHSKKMLKEYNEVITYFLENNSSDRGSDLKELKKLSVIPKNIALRITYMSKDGGVLYDSYKDNTTMDNHKSREEFIQAQKYGSGASVRFSKTLNEETIYYATKLSDGSVIRTSEVINSSVLLKNTDMKYYLTALAISLILGSIIAIRITNSITKPINDLQFITSRIAYGDFHKRVEIKTKDELGSLGDSFNHMADTLELTLKELISNQSRLTAILKSMGSGVIAIDKYHKVIMVNPYVRKLFSIVISEDQIKGMKIEDIVADKNFIERILNKEDNVDIKLDMYGGKHIRIRTSELLEGDDEMGIVIVIEDITDYKTLENMRSEFVANVSHELKTPVTSIKGFAETLKYVDDTETRNRFLGIIEEESDRLTRLIQDILALYDIEKQENITKEFFDINEITSSVKLLTIKNARSRNVKLNVDGEIKELFYGDKDKFKQMVLNLVDNAIKYSGENSSVKLKIYEDLDMVYIDVEDDGVGISKEHLDRIFERFYRVDKARSREKGGTGLGLAIVKHIVNSFNGYINVESEISKGTKFKISLPKNI
ncbi:HAMP domain-containing sensor histidine kinase [uncultured Clostridium sp.]|uniref:HAMP domain-containing sensor histidine kinase n=1 Tax=uncultured Clostridium sp. TaxID=59620 RepID=UPI002609A6AB|nr:HAMP domain-containing sensor histidine kinase [uncultured Clostridium sp.]